MIVVKPLPEKAFGSIRCTTGKILNVISWSDLALRTNLDWSA
jgi:hypothetical protein